ncbi:glycosyltransferase family 2 protein [Lactobacillus delbrueckii subsp. bulgaricus]|uniref:glycosyltransferase family 2 protein n=1 Tax=Lactobacillus delbrueckii TaxID=1584 RepID=UPI001BFF71A6|nr:beta(1,3)galactosyltransferase EpsH [Lactobacillus delbrueckii subsp. bulgaricus]MBT8928931.1 beta(1,3)galactosyltransferase EpsH [Lactobacillus delbrueckii subsp. bulgaricus]
MPKVSVIMSVYNCKDFDLLKKSVESIINQTFTDWEMIMYNDGSTDTGKTVKYLLQASTWDDRIKFIDNPENHGLAYAKNQMISASSGKYIAAQDDDDISEPTRLAEEVAFLDKHPEYAFVGSLATLFDKNGTWGHYHLDEKPDKISFLWNSPFHHPTVVFRRDVLEQVNGYRVSKETMRAEDYDLFFRLYAKGYKGYNIQRELYEYRVEQHRQSKYRPMKDRIQEAKVRYRGYKGLGIFGKGIPYIVKPIIAGLMPTRVFSKFQNRQYLNR